ncbi:MAG: hypothetical protein HOD92_12760 [Deltaproteobacteria bacterium]|jgi:hypothetical protein|nr:hypothetical protein [Deltaproteobacteria bacterium]
MQRYHMSRLADPTTSHCQVCNTEHAHSLWGVSSQQAAQHFVLQEKHPERFSKLVAHIEALWGQKSCDVVQCDGCGFCYSNPTLPEIKNFTL